MQNKFVRVEGGTHVEVVVHPDEIRSEPEPTPLKNYTIMLINMTDLQMALACINYRPGQHNEWRPIRPPVGRTCHSDYDTCFRNHDWQPVSTCDCNDAAFELTLITVPDSNGNARGATWRIDPSCSFDGGAIALN